MENRRDKFNKRTVCVPTSCIIMFTWCSSEFGEVAETSRFLNLPARRKSIAHEHEVFSDISATAEQFIFLMRTIGTSPACFLLLTRSYRQENRIRRTVQPAINPRLRAGTLLTGNLFHGNLLDSRAYGRVVSVIAVKLGPLPFEVSFDYDAASPPPRPLDTLACAPPG